MNRTGAAGRKGVPAATVVAFLDHYTYTGTEYNGVGEHGALAPVGPRVKRINGVTIPTSTQRSIRRWRNGQVQYVSAKGLAQVLLTFGFDLPHFHGWCKLHRRPIT
jgi:hypothetical protein